MMFNYPPFGLKNPYGYRQNQYNLQGPYINRQVYRSNMHQPSSQTIKNTQKVESIKEAKKIESRNDDGCFEIFGITLYFDDILLICLLFFLYNEGVEDQYLFIALVLLLLS